MNTFLKSLVLCCGIVALLVCDASAGIDVKVKVRNLTFIGMAVPPCRQPTTGTCDMEFTVSIPWLHNPISDSNEVVIETDGPHHYITATLVGIDSDFEPDLTIDQSDSNIEMETITIGTFTLTVPGVSNLPSQSVTVEGEAFNSGSQSFRIYLD